MGSVATPPFDVKRVAIVGAGPCGLDAAKYLLGQHAFDEVVIFEQQAEVGGVWNYSDRPSPEDTLRVPQTDPFVPPDPPIYAEDGAALFPSPMYRLLHTNIPSTLMAYTDLEFPKDELIFPSRAVVQEYIVTYAKDIRHLVRFSTVVTNIALKVVGGRDTWDVKVEPSTGGQAATQNFDAVVVASGHYTTIFIPPVSGIYEFHKAHPGVITHAKYYRYPDVYAGKKVVVVGNGPSGVDIGAQISRVCRQPLLLSIRSATPPDSLAHIGAEEVSQIVEFLVPEKGVRFQDGRIETDIDAIIFCTGYLYSFPFLESLEPPLVVTGKRVCGLYKHLFHIRHPTLVFPGLPIRVVPFGVSEGQAAVFARVWANALQLPSAEEMREWEDAQVKEKGDKLHVFPKSGDIEYIKEMHDWAAQTTGPPGKVPPLWDRELCWERSIFAEAKLKFEKGGRRATSLAQLGFKYQPEEDIDRKTDDLL